MPLALAGLSLTAEVPEALPREALPLEVWRLVAAALEESKAEPGSLGAWSAEAFPAAAPARAQCLAAFWRLKASATEPGLPGVPRIRG